MPVIEAANGVVTHINVFTVAPENQQALVDSLTAGTIRSGLHAEAD